MLLAETGATLTERLADAAGVMVVGMAIVFLSLVAIGELVGLLGRAYARAVRTEPLTPLGEAVARATADRVDPRTLAVLAAACHAMLGGPHRIRHVLVLKSVPGSAWAEAGRQLIHAGRRTK